MTTYTVRVTGYDDDGAPCASTFTVEARDRADAANEALAAARDCGWQDCNTGRIEEQQPTAAERIRAAYAPPARVLEERAQLADRIGDEGSPRYCPTCGADVIGNDPHAPDCPELEEEQRRPEPTTPEGATAHDLARGILADPGASWRYSQNVRELARLVLASDTLEELER